MAPGFAMLIEPKAGVGVITLLNVASAAQIFIPSLRLARWDVVRPLSISACIAYPAGLALLVALDALVIRRAIGATVVGCALLLLSGYRLKGGYTTLRTAVAGACSGALNGLTGAGGPPTILYLLSGDDPPPRTRANFIVFFTIMQAVAIPQLLYASVLTTRLAVTAALLLPVYMAATHLGVKLFPLASPALYRRIAIAILIARGAVALLA
jgi:uncharacterized membrane protein YfcA